MPDQEHAAKADAARAMDDVLAAEQEAREAMDACRKEAEQILEAAREEARRIAHLATERITRLHARCDQLAQGQIAQLQAEIQRAAPRAELDASDQVMLEAAARRLAVRLTQSGHE
jgi:vacuolar-type H+-ATPase subunit H